MRECPLSLSVLKTLALLCNDFWKDLIFFFAQSTICLSSSDKQKCFFIGAAEFLCTVLLCIPAWLPSCTVKPVVYYAIPVGVLCRLELLCTVRILLVDIGNQVRALVWPGRQARQNVRENMLLIKFGGVVFVAPHMQRVLLSPILPLLRKTGIHPCQAVMWQS